MILLFKTNDDASVAKLAGYLQELNKNHEGKQVAFRITVKKNRAIRSNDQNARYWAILTAIAVVTGYTTDELHDYYKKKFNGKWILDEFVPSSTTVLDTLEFTVYMNKVQQHGKDFHNVKFVDPTAANYQAWLEEVDHNYNKMWAEISIE